MSVYICIYTKRVGNEIPTGKIAPTKELLNLKPKVTYTVKTISVDVCDVLQVITKFL
jgi:hypothetical protein